MTPRSLRGANALVTGATGGPAALLRGLPRVRDRCRMYARARARARCAQAPRAFGETTPERVAGAVVDAIRKDLPEVVAWPHPIRPAIAIGELSPRFGAWLTRRSGIRRTFYRPAVARQGGRA